ncbi:pilus assembly protein N-terminal domain-containing protein [Xanthobacter sp. TB0139]|uniref:pilus assembly protein N-terminal domain-containing protein n=1 Tax=Xanthobacter sp. TB0139 TaxID=3459178 RepID=UPI004039682A
MSVLRRVALAVLAALSLSSAQAQSLPPQLRGYIQMSIDQARAFTLPEGAKIVIIGNPVIADTTTTPLEDRLLTILTSKSYGVTQLQVLDDKGRLLDTAVVNVGRENRDIVTIHTGPKERASFNCAPVCSPVPALGDSPEAFSAANSQIQQRSSRAEGN